MVTRNVVVSDSSSDTQNTLLHILYTLLTGWSLSATYDKRIYKKRSWSWCNCAALLVCCSNFMILIRYLQSSIQTAQLLISFRNPLVNPQITLTFPPLILARLPWLSPKHLQIFTIKLEGVIEQISACWHESICVGCVYFQKMFFGNDLFIYIETIDGN
jgi:hypothetical protein